tara:strand:- start:756 stop:1475 length:720 start_codon:yes stop_codon:yes gene_type:complete
VHLNDIYLILVGFLSEVLGTLSGFGSSTFFVPAALTLKSFDFVLALTGILHCFGNLFRIAMFYQAFDWKQFSKFAVLFIGFTGVGALLTGYVGSKWMELALGIFLVLYGLVAWFRLDQIQSLPKSVSVFLMGASGFSTGLIGTGGALRGVSLSAMGLSKEAFIFTSAGIDLFGDLLRTGIYLVQGYMEWDQWFYIPLLGGAALCGSFVGKRILNRMDQRQFERVVAVFVFLSGIGILVN